MSMGLLYSKDVLSCIEDLKPLYQWNVFAFLEKTSRSIFSNQTIRQYILTYNLDNYSPNRNESAPFFVATQVV